MAGRLFISNSNMKKLLFKIIIVLVSLVIIDKLTGLVGNYIIEKLNEENYVGDAALLNYSLNSVTPDIVIVGSSTALCHYNPKIISDSLSFKEEGDSIRVFNAGASTQGIAYANALVKSIISRRVPKLIIMDLQPQFLYYGFSNEQMSTLRPYYGYNDYITEVFNIHTTGREQFLLKSNLYRLNTNFLRLALSFIKPTGSDGFYAHEGELEEMPKKIDEELPDSFDENSVKELCEIVEICNSNRVKLVFVISPYLNHVYKDKYVIDKVEQLCEQLKVPLINKETTLKYQKKEYFFDQRHMNVEGAQLFTKDLCGDIKSISIDAYIE